MNNKFLITRVLARNPSLRPSIHTFFLSFQVESLCDAKRKLFPFPIRLLEYLKRYQNRVDSDKPPVAVVN